jgi:hypothetical protein
MLQEVEESMATLLSAAEQVLQELEEEARANWEERAIYHATQVTNQAGKAFETQSENRWSRRDCTEYQDELDWVMRTCQPRCAGWLAPDRSESTTSISGPRGSWRDFSKLMEDYQRKDVLRLGAAVRMSRSIRMSSTLSICPRREWSMRTPFPWIDGPPCQSTSWESNGRNGPV